MLKITHIGGPTALLEIGGRRVLTDPTFDPAGGKYSFGWGTGSEKLDAPRVSAEELGEVDAVLLSHDQHEDNLDKAGREYLPHAGRVITTESGAKRLKANSEGLAPWAQTTLEEIRITATPCRHGPPLSRPIVGEVIGFLLEWEGQQGGAFWISGDTVWFPGVAEVGKRFDVGTALLHFGGVRFPISGPLRYTMNGAEGARTAKELDIKQVLPIHYEGWRHFREGRDGVVQAFAEAGLTERLQWLEPGVAAPVEV